MKALNGFLALAMAAMPFAVVAQTAPAAVKMWRLDCGTVQINDLDVFSDTRAYVGQKKTLTASCYLIRHGDTYMLWDTGLPVALKGAPLSAQEAMSATLRETIAEQIARINVKPGQVSIVGISHLHFDHVGQASAFPGARLLIGVKDWAALTSKPPMDGVDPKPLANWIDGGGKAEPVKGDRDIFGDGSVTMIDLPGHTPGHHGLLVKLAKSGTILLSGDEFHFSENMANNGVPAFNFDRAQTLASNDRFRTLAKNLNAKIIIQHDPRDIAKLPAFPAAAE